VQNHISHESQAGTLTQATFAKALAEAREAVEGEVPHCTTLQGDFQHEDMTKVSIFGHNAGPDKTFGEYKCHPKSDFQLTIKSSEDKDIPCLVINDANGFSSAYWPIMTFDAEK
jgi:hypothetical protein